MAAAAVAVMVVVANTGCTHASSRADDLLGETLERASTAIPERDDLIVVIQDASPLVEREPTFTVDQSSSSRWTVIAACADDADLAAALHLELVVIPSETVTPQILSGVLEGQYADSAVCDWTL